MQERCSNPEVEVLVDIVVPQTTITLRENSGNMQVRVQEEQAAEYPTDEPPESGDKAEQSPVGLGFFYTVCCPSIIINKMFNDSFIILITVTTDVGDFSLCDTSSPAPYSSTTSSEPAGHASGVYKICNTHIYLYTFTYLNSDSPGFTFMCIRVHIFDTAKNSEDSIPCFLFRATTTEENGGSPAFIFRDEFI